MNAAASTWTGRDTGDWQPGHLVDAKYEIEARLGAGAMGVVYRARHVDLDVHVALKVMRSELGSDDLNRERMLREARSAAALKHHNVVRVLDVGRLPNGLPFIVMEYLEGQNLEQHLREHGPLSVADAANYVIQTCDGIGEAHERGIVHRDLKPENLFLARQPDGGELIKVFDFGISKQLGVQALRATRPFDTVGSPVYMSPEQMNPAAQVDARCDIWSLGVVLTELCTHELPFVASSLPELCQQISSGAPRLPSQYLPALPKTLDDIVERCLQRDPALRYPSAAALADALRELLQDEQGRTLSRASGWQLARTALQPSTAPCAQSGPLLSSEQPPPARRHAGLRASGFGLGLLGSAVLGAWLLLPRSTDAVAADGAAISAVRATDSADVGETAPKLANPPRSAAAAALGPSAPVPVPVLTPKAAPPPGELAETARTRRTRPARAKPASADSLAAGKGSLSAAARTPTHPLPAAKVDPIRQPWDLSAFGGRR